MAQNTHLKEIEGKANLYHGDGMMGAEFMATVVLNARQLSHHQESVKI